LSALSRLRGVGSKVHQGGRVSSRPRAKKQKEKREESENFEKKKKIRFGPMNARTGGDTKRGDGCKGGRRGLYGGARKRGKIFKRQREAHQAAIVRRERGRATNLHGFTLSSRP